MHRKVTTIKLIDISFTAHPAIDVPEEIILAHKEGLAYVAYLPKNWEIIVIEHISHVTQLVKDNIRYSFFKSRNNFFHIPFKTLWYVRQQKPDVILVQGLVFPVQTIMLWLIAGRRCKILMQHHAEKPFPDIRRLFQKIADHCVTAYLFTSTGNTIAWKTAKIIRQGQKCYEVLEGATDMKIQDKATSKALVGMTGKYDFLWVGSLSARKDPITVLLGFEQYLKENTEARLYMVYQDNDLLAEVKTLISGSPYLSKAVSLTGKINHNVVVNWFNAADFFLSGSHSEGSGYALIESMNCGCIPIVTDIPPFRKITGKHGLLFTPGDPESLCAALSKIKTISIEDAHAAIVRYAQQELTFKAIADQVYAVIDDVTTK